MRRAAKGFLALTSFLTIIPTGVLDLELAARYFYFSPLVGLIRGLVTSATTYLALLLFRDYLIAAAVALAVHAVIQGLNHVDGFIDFGEAVASGRRGAEALKIVKDLHKGSFAIAVFTLYALLALALLRGLISVEDTGLVLLVLTLAEVTSCISMFLLLLVGDRPNYEGLGSIFMRYVKGASSIVFFIIVSAASVTASLLLYRRLMTSSLLITSVSIASAVLVAIISKYLGRAVVGFTQGDVVGFCNEVSWVAVIAASLAVILNFW